MHNFPNLSSTISINEITEDLPADSLKLFTPFASSVMICQNFPMYGIWFISILLMIYVGHSRTIVGLEQSQMDNNKIFLLLLDPLKEKRDILKIKTTLCGDAVHRYIRKSVRQEKHQQYELVFINGLLSDSKEKEVSMHYVPWIVPYSCKFPSAQIFVNLS